MSLGVWGLAQRNVKHKPGRAFGLTALTAALCLVLFISSFLIISLRNGIHSLSRRMGADLIVVPEGYDSKITGAILRGEPNSFFFDESVADRIREIPGVSEASPQIYLATLSAGCCSYPLQLIGIDFDTDFSVVPWLKTQVKLPLEKDEVIVGSRIVGAYHSEVKFFGRPFRIKGRLAETGMGFDTSVFMGMKETRELASEFHKMIGSPVSEDPRLISSVMVKVRQGEDVGEVYKRIQGCFQGEGIYVLKSKQMMSGIASDLEHLMRYLVVLILLLWGLSFLVLMLVYSVSFHERKRELATLRILGATKRKLRHIYLAEVIWINFIGALSGAVLGAVGSVLFGPAFGASLNMPFLEPKRSVFFLLFLLTVLLGTALGPLSSLFSLHQMNRGEVALLSRENT